MKDEEFLKLARELGTMSPEHEDEKFIVFSGAIIFPNRITFLSLCREIERKALERAAEKCAEIDGGENEFSRAIRAMIKEKE